MRSDSLETDRGNPMENMPPMTNLESHLEMIGELHGTDGTDNRVFKSPPQLNNTKSAFQNLGSVVEQNIVYEETKEIVNFDKDYEGENQGQVFII
jgi:hypothetical protein